MSDDWRVRVVLADDGQARKLAGELARWGERHELGRGFADRVIVSRDGAELFAYADRRERAEAAAALIRSAAAKRRWEVSTELRRWHPVAEQWEDPDRPLPRTEAERAAERQEAMEGEREESRAQGFPAFEVRVRAPSRQAAHQLAQRLAAEGLDAVQRWQFLVLGAPDEDTARALAERIRREAPAGSAVAVEASVGEAAAEAPLATPFNSPFAVFGGLGG